MFSHQQVLVLVSVTVCVLSLCYLNMSNSVPSSPPLELPWTWQLQSGVDLLRNPRYNKGLSFETSERKALRVHGLMPPRVLNMEQQIQKEMMAVRSFDKPINKYLYVMNLLDRNERLFYATLAENLAELMPVVYTPTVGEACQRFHQIFQRPRGLYLTIKDRGHIYEILKNWPQKNIKAIVFTDGERILGLGDLGAGGMGIPIGKLALYTACAGIKPHQLLPVMIDVGTDNEALLNDPYYVGLNQKRDRSQAYDELIKEFMTAATRRFSKNILLQFEDFANRNAFRLLQEHKDHFNTFNDDIQGTASVAVAGILASLRVTGQKSKDQVVVLFGAGSAGLGIANLIAEAVREEDPSVSEAESRRNIWLVDSRGLVVTDRPKGGVTETKAPFAHPHAPIDSLLEIVKTLKPSILIGVAGQAKVFTEEVCRTMADAHERPIIFPMSNPTSKAECTARQAFDWTDERVIFASGSPFPPIELKDGRTITPAQGNNAYVFPGLALGLIAAGATRCPERLFYIAARRLADLVTEEDLARLAVFPPLESIRSVSFDIAVAVATEIFRLDLASVVEPKDVAQLVRSHQFNHQQYPSYVDSREE